MTSRYETTLDLGVLGVCNATIGYDPDWENDVQWVLVHRANSTNFEYEIDFDHLSESAQNAIMYGINRQEAKNSSIAQDLALFDRTEARAINRSR